MSNCPLCNLDPAPVSSNDKPRRLFHRAWQSTQWLFTATVLALIPKCPFCVMAYVALFTGVGISVSTARWIQILMLTLCLSSLAYLAVKFWRKRAGVQGRVISSSDR
jgi:hypothetical protein